MYFTRKQGPVFRPMLSCKDKKFFLQEVLI